MLERNKPVSNYCFRKFLERRNFASLEPIIQRTLLLPDILFQMQFEITLRAHIECFELGFFLQSRGFLLHKLISMATVQTQTLR